MRKGASALLVVAVLLAACQPADRDFEPVVIDPVELESFSDEFFATQMEKLQIPGVAFVLAQNGEIVLAKGYGYADLETGRAVSAETTVMRIGSISKPFVATAVMQLVEQGKLDLHTDVNHYLTTFQLEDTYPDPVTLAHLLTHTGGFEDPAYATSTDAQQIPPLAEHLAGNMPPRTHPPGEEHVYSGYGYSLAALVVEEVSGTPFDLYVEQKILEPLGMTRSRYLLGPPLPEQMATGYFSQDGVQIRQPMDYDEDYPGGSIVSTAEDMAHFLLAHLQDGCYQGACILEAATVAEMHERQAETPFKGQGVTLGFVEAIQEGQRLVGHSGAIRGFGSSLNLLPEHDLGYFFAFNEECYLTSACDVVSAFREQFLEQFLSD
jgi:CubicO group peptidase (beta-lactamase class C family)